jgi:hypothetical protein
MGEIVIMGMGINSPTVTLPMSATKEEIAGALLATCKHCDATDSYNFGQCISCDEQQEAGV